MQTTNTRITVNAEPADDTNVLNYLLQHVRGLSPSSLTPAYALSGDSDTE